MVFWGNSKQFIEFGIERNNIQKMIVEGRLQKILNVKEFGVYCRQLIILGDVIQWMIDKKKI